MCIRDRQQVAGQDRAGRGGSAVVNGEQEMHRLVLLSMVRRPEQPGAVRAPDIGDHALGVSDPGPLGVLIFVQVPAFTSVQALP